MRLPLYVEFEGKRVAVIGGGGVGTSRAKKFIEAGADVTVFSLEFSDELRKLESEGRVKLVRASVEELDFESVVPHFHLIVVAIGERKFNDEIIRIATKHKTLVNLANDAEATEVVVPFEGCVNGVRFAITTEGKSGIVARKVREIFEETLKERKDVSCLLEVMDHVKRYMKSTGVPVSVRMKIYPALGRDRKLLELVESCRVEEAKAYAEKFIRDVVSGKLHIEEGIDF